MLLMSCSTTLLPSHYGMTICFAGSAHILGKLEGDNVSSGLRQLCASQVDPLSKVTIE